MSRSSQLYIMIKPTLEARRSIAGCRFALGLDESYPLDRLHCTMLRLGDCELWSPAMIDRLGDALGMVQSAPFEVRFEQAETRLLRGRSGMPEPAQFHRALRRHLAMHGIMIPDHGFWLHLSLAYKGPELKGVHRIGPIGWQVGEFLLIRSVTGLGHEEIGRWSLDSPQLKLAL